MNARDAGRVTETRVETKHNGRGTKLVETDFWDQRGKQEINTNNGKRDLPKVAARHLP